MPDAKEVLEHLEKKPKFKVGDRVVSEYFGEGTVTMVDDFMSYPVTVVFDDSPVAKAQCFTLEGFYYTTERDYVTDNVVRDERDIRLINEEPTATTEEVKPFGVFMHELQQYAVKQAKENAINPSHYRAEGIPEAIDIMRGLMTDEQLEGFLWGNIIKYAYRYGRKGDTQGAKTETAAKIKWYADAMIGYLSGH